MGTRLELRDDINHACELNLMQASTQPSHWHDRKSAQKKRNNGETLTGRKRSAGYFLISVDFPAGKSQNIHWASGQSEIWSRDIHMQTQCPAQWIPLFHFSARKLKNNHREIIKTFQTLLVTSLAISDTSRPSLEGKRLNPTKILSPRTWTPKKEKKNTWQFSNFFCSWLPLVFALGSNQLSSLYL